MMNLIIMAAALLIGAVVQQTAPGAALLGQAKAPLVLSVVLYYALHRSFALMITAAVAGGVLCDGLEALPMGSSVLVFGALGIAAWQYRNVVFTTRSVTHMVFGFIAGLGLTFGVYLLLLAGDESARATPFFRIVLKGVGAGLLGMFLAPAIFAVLERLDRWTGNISVETAA